jgi:hypothetical protein
MPQLRQDATIQQNNGPLLTELKPIGIVEKVRIVLSKGIFLYTEDATPLIIRIKPSLEYTQIIGNGTLKAQINFTDRTDLLKDGIRYIAIPIAHVTWFQKVTLIVPLLATRRKVQDDVGVTLLKGISFLGIGKVDRKL